MDQTSLNKNARKKTDSREYALDYGSFYDFGELNTKPHTRNYRTESFSFSSNTGIEDVFAPQSEIYDGRPGRIRASSLSIPQHSISTAFGPSVFASDWVPKSNSELIPPSVESLKPMEEPAQLEEQEELSGAIRMFTFLDLDDPINSPPSRKNTGGTPSKIRSVTEPFSNANTILPTEKVLFKDPDESLEDAPNPASENVWWEDMAQMHSLPANTTSSSQSIAPNSPLNDPLVDRSGSESPTHEFMSPSRSLWIGNIDSSFGSEELQQIFSKFGTIESIRMLPEKECAFVNYFKLDDALAAREQMQGGRIGNCIVRIGFGKTEAIHDIQGMQPTKSLWVGNILPTTKPSDLEAIFAKYGKVESARVLTHKNCGFVNFYSLEEAMNAKNELNGQDIGGSIVKIGYAKVPAKVEPPMTATQALANPTVLTTLASQAMERVFFQPNPSPWGNTNNTANINPLSVTPRSESSGNISIDDSTDHTFAGGKANLNQDYYYSSIITTGDLNTDRKVDQNRLRDIRKRLESHIPSRELELIYYEVIDEARELCSDYIGNVVIQKLMEKCSDPQRLRLIENISPRMASLGIHKNGTWAIQKIIDCAKTSPQIDAIVEALKRYTPLLLLDQFGNYVIQCCLRLGTQKNQFIFDAMQAKCWELGQGRFGARAMKACLESQYTTKRQQKQVSLAIVQNCVQLSMNSNGSILMTWLLDMSQLPGRYRAVAPLMQPNIILLCSHKLSLSTIFKLVNQRVEMDARDIIIKAIFYNENNLHQILMDQNNGVSLVQKILASGCVSADERAVLGSITKRVLGTISNAQDSYLAYNRLLDELATLPNNPPPVDSLNDDEVVSPLTSHPGFFPKSVSPKKSQSLTDETIKFPSKNFDATQYGASPSALPTPNHSPTQYYNQSYYAPTYGYSQPYYPPNSNFNSGATTFNSFQQSAAGSAESHYPI
ncbi:hypothetical protein HDV06_003331 [Boothiomyces sp. JEL0866]|nr:hypothetical protein HDV06_003331 [Boothiomyces sp. JEL0866]